MLLMKICMAEVGIVVEAEGEDGVGAGVGTQTMEIIKIMMDTRTGAEAVGEEEVGVIVVLVMKEVEDIAVDVQGWVVVAPGAVTTPTRPYQ
ncbi:hypothetical protein HRI_004571400 [Hibiscus trionum]|uniref:Uncharacterized protein n=1 Tax=Hibiscus trionum TaxID=183268 RepID=A0A9W7J6G3_HIBTR|nr:hypothetical protein HRI_004571400 [Hibiscus trionum]